jgi:hypothetical protein
MKITKENMKKVMNKETPIYFIAYIEDGQFKNGVITQHPFTFQNNSNVVLSNYHKVTPEEEKDYSYNYE